MKVLVTGAGGRIGSHLSRALLTEGHTVQGFGLPGDPGLARLAELGARVFYGDLLVPDDLVPAVTGVDAVCHLGAALTTHDVPDHRFVDVNFRGTFNVLEAARQHAPRIRRFVYTSSDAVYVTAPSSGRTGTPPPGDADGGDPIDESTPLQPGTVYGASKAGAEMLSRSFWKTYGIPYTVMRPTATANPDEFLQPASVFGRRWFVKAAISWFETHPGGLEEQELLTELRKAGDGTDKDQLYLLVGPDGEAGTVTYADARDGAAGMRAMLENDRAIGEAFNIGPAAPCSERDFTEHLGRRLGLEVVEIRQRRPRPHWRVSSHKARDLLGYEPLRSPLGMIDEAAERLAAVKGRPE